MKVSLTTNKQYGQKEANKEKNHSYVAGNRSYRNNEKLSAVLLFSGFYVANATSDDTQKLI